MHTIIRFLCIGVAASLLVVSVSAQSKVATTAAPFLGISVGPRAAAMGSAFVAVGSDASAMYWNPGALSRTMQSQILAAHTSWLYGTDFNWIGLQIAFDDATTVGVSLTQLAYGDEPVTTELSPEGTGEFWNAQDIAFGATYARNITDRFSIGASFKYITQRIWHTSASGFAFDVGLLFITPFDGMRIGMSMSNFGTDMRMDGKDLVRRIDIDPENTGGNKTIVAELKTDSWELPLSIRAGVAYDVALAQNITFTAAADAVRPNDNDEFVNLGGEVSYNDMVFIRAGYKQLFLSETEEGLTAGIGVSYPLFGSTLVMIDYAYQDFGKFDFVQTVTLGVTF